MTIKIMLDLVAFMPTRAHDADAGYDLFSPYTVPVPCARNMGDGIAQIGYATIDTGVHIEIPKGYVGFIKSKSGLNVNHGITTDGVIDSGYTGSIHVKLYNHSENNYMVNRGDKIAQLVILPILTPDLDIADHLEATERGDGGFGSTGRGLFMKAAQDQNVGCVAVDNVNHPSHYETGKFECIDVMIETQGVEAVKDFCLCNAFKYLYRHNGKNGVEDIKKAKWYIDKYLELEGDQDVKGNTIAEGA